MENLFSMTLKTEVTRLDNARMHRANRNFVYLVAGYLKVVHHTDRRLFPRLTAPRISPGNQRRMKTERFEPGVPIELQAALLGYLTFEQLHLRTDSGYGGEGCFSGFSADNPDDPFCVACKDA